MDINREELVQQMESVAAALAPREIIDQSNCFVFDNGEVITYNGEIACQRPTSLELTGALPAEQFLQTISKMPDEMLRFVADEGKLRIQGRRKRATVRMEMDIRIPLDELDDPETWEPLDPEFGEAIELVRQCASKNESKLQLTCVHVTPDFVEASDNYQISRFQVETPIEKPFLVRAESIKHITAMGADEISVTDSWVHFRNEQGLVISCRTYLQDFKDYDQFYGQKGDHIELPKSLAEVADRANVFSEDELLALTIQPGSVRVRSEGRYGDYKETKDINYKGPELDFRMTKTLLDTVVEKYDHCQVKDRLLIINRGRFEYITTLAAANANGQGNEKTD